MNKLYKLIAVQSRLNPIANLDRLIADGYECPITFQTITAQSVVVAVPNENGSYYFISKEGYDELKNKQDGSVKHPLNTDITIKCSEMLLIKPEVTPDIPLIAAMKTEGTCLISDESYEDAGAVVSFPLGNGEYNFMTMDAFIKWTVQNPMQELVKNPFTGEKCKFEDLKFLSKNKQSEWSILNGQYKHTGQFSITIDKTCYEFSKSTVKILDFNEKSVATCSKGGTVKHFRNQKVYQLSTISGDVYSVVDNKDQLKLMRILPDGSRLTGYASRSDLLNPDGNVNFYYAKKTHSDGSSISGKVSSVSSNGDMSFTGRVTQETLGSNGDTFKVSYIEKKDIYGRVSPVRQKLEVISKGISYDVPHNGQTFDYSKAKITSRMDGSVITGRLYTQPDGSFGFMHRAPVTRYFPNRNVIIKCNWNANTKNTYLPERNVYLPNQSPHLLNSRPVRVY